MTALVLIYNTVVQCSIVQYVKNPGPVDALPLVPCRTEPVLKIGAVDLYCTLCSRQFTDHKKGKWLCHQGMAARQRAYDRGYRGSRPPQPRDQSLHYSHKRGSVRRSSTQRVPNYSGCLQLDYDTLHAGWTSSWLWRHSPNTLAEHKPHPPNCCQIGRSWVTVDAEAIVVIE